MSWLRPSKRSASVFLPPGASKTYSLSTFTHGNCRRSALTASRCFVRFFSLASSSLRAAFHSSRDTTLGLSIVLLLLTSLLLTLSPFSSPATRFPPPSRRFRPLTKIRVHITPALRNPLPMLLLNHSKRRMTKLDQRPAIHLCQSVLQIRHNRIRHEQRPANLQQRR